MQGGEYNRKTIRLQGYDYSEPGFYYVTICVNGHKNLLGKTVDNIDKYQGKIVKLSEIGKIVEEELKMIPSYFSNIDLDEYVIMSNHLHMIIEIGENV